MRTAPAVSVQCTGGPYWRAWCALVPAGAMAAVLAWGLAHLGWPGIGAVVSLALGAILALGLWWRSRRPPALLAWNGQQWSADAVAGTVAVMMDLGPWMLLRLQATDRLSFRWLPVSEREAGPAWHLLRAAVFARPPQPPAAAAPGAGRSAHG